MAIIGFPYNSQDKDRAINAETYRRLLSKYFTTGVFPNPSTQFQVYATTGMNLTVKAGSANIEGVYVEMESDDSVTIENASSQPRIDRIVLKHDDSTEVRATTLVVKKGTPSSNPQAPTLERTATVYEIALADVRVDVGTASIAQSDITDVRLDSRLCGLVSATITSIDTTTFFEQMNDDFNTWFDGVKGTLGEDSAGNLLNLINEVKANYIPKTDIVDDVNTEDSAKPLSARQGKILNDKIERKTIKLLATTINTSYTPFSVDNFENYDYLILSVKPSGSSDKRYLASTIIIPTLEYISYNVIQQCVYGAESNNYVADLKITSKTTGEIKSKSSHDKAELLGVIL